MGAEDADGEYINLGEMVATLLDTGNSYIFNSPDGKDAKSLQRMLNSQAQGNGGPLEQWDGDVFPDYYNVDSMKVLELYAKHIGAELGEAPPNEEEEW